MRHTLQIASFCIALFLVACGKESRQSAPNETNAVPEQSIPTDLTEAEREFLDTMKQAFSQNAPGPLVDRICWDGVDDMLHKKLDDHFVVGVGRGLKRFDFQRVNPNERTKTTKNGSNATANPNLPVKWILVVYHPSDKGTETCAEYLLGEKDGLIQFTMAITQ